MRILVTAHSIAPSTGGGRVGTLGICRGLAGRGHQVTLVATNADGKGTIDVPLGVPTEQEGVETYFYPVQLSLWGNAFSLPMARAMKRNVPQSDIVLIHSLYQFTSTVAAYYCRKNKVPYILRPHGTLDPFLVYRRRRFLKWAYINVFEEKNFRHAAAIQYSSKMEEAMTKQFVDAGSRSLVIPEGINLAGFSNLPIRGLFRTRYPKTIGKTLILFLGRFDQKKGIELLVNAYSEVARRRADVHLVLVGGGEQSYTEYIVKLVRDRGITRRVTLTGMLSDQEKIAALTDADVFALPSRGENFGISVVEAMACGLPVLISDQVGICPEITAAEAGIVTQCDSREIAVALERLIDDPDLRRRFGEHGKCLAETHFGLDRMAERMEVAYSQFVTGQKTTSGIA